MAVELVGTPAALTLVVEDDGSGFDAESVRATTPGRFGLVGMNERARLLGGKLHIASAPGRGTRIEVRVPLGSTREEATE